MPRGIKKRKDRTTIRSKAVNIRLTSAEFEQLKKTMAVNGYQGSISSYLRSIIKSSVK